METLHAFTGNAAALDAARRPGHASAPASRATCRRRACCATRRRWRSANGLDHDRALRAVTLDAAKLLGIDEEYGSIEVGKVADLVLYDGDPFEHATHVTHTIMGGRVVYDRADYLKLPFERRILPLLGGGSGVGCCMGW